MCCGRTRENTPDSVTAQTIATRPQASAGVIAGVSVQGVSVQYQGTTSMTVIGPVSGRVYRFSNPGSRVQPDPRDLSALATISKLRFIR